MLTAQKTDEATIASVPTSERNIEDLLSKEWLLTNERGGYASSTIVCCNTRRYHGLLIGSLNPPVDRIMALANCLEMIIANESHPSEGRGEGPSQRRDGTGAKIFNLSTFEFNEKFAPAGFSHIKRFRRDTGVHFDYQLDGLELTKSVYLLRQRDTVAVVYDFTNIKRPVEFALRPFIGLRDFHTLQKSYAHILSNWVGSGLVIRHNIPQSCELFLSCPAMKFEKDGQWWFNFVYRNDKQRGQDFTEDLWTPGFFKCKVDSAARIVLWGSLSGPSEKCEPISTDIETICKDLRNHQSNIIARAKTRDKKSAARYINNTRNGEPRPSERQGEILKTLFLAADQFIVKRRTSLTCGVNNADRRRKGTQDDTRDMQCDSKTTILAGFPWFADWGRDSFIALPGLLLSTARFEEAKSVLITFAQAADEGMIPNRFDDHSNTAYFNSIDASLWFINAAFGYLDTTADCETFTQQLLATIVRIIESYQTGSRFGICADADGLITGGDEETQLTWMDTKYEGTAFTPRYGKAVEINALWYNSLCRLARFYADRDVEKAEHYHTMADKVETGFCKLFWNETVGYLNDCILPDGSVDTSLRPNQIFAVSLPFSPLPAHQQASVVEMVHKNLLTPYGLRTLNAEDSRYKDKYTGPQQMRDEAYHQGTVWPYLIGPFVEAYLKVNSFSKKSKRKAAEFIEPLMRHLTEDGCLGQVNEIFDGSAPHKPRGCIAQAWSVAELIRAYQLINS